MLLFIVFLLVVNICFTAAVGLILIKSYDVKAIPAPKVSDQIQQGIFDYTQVRNSPKTTLKLIKDE
jgi:hypothetical protein